MSTTQPTIEKKRSSILLNISISLFSILICFGLIELAFRVMSTDQAPVRQLIHVDAAAGHLAFEANSRGLYETEEFEFVIQANEYGRRDIYWTEEQVSDPENILFVGDSFVLGYGVKDEYTMPNLLEDLHKQESKTVEVFNFGIGGGVALPQYKELFLRALDMGIEARTVIVGIFVGNDFTPENIVVDNRATEDSEGKATEVAVEEKKASRMSLKSAIASLKTYQFVRDRVKASPLAIDMILRIGNLIGVNLYDSPSSYLYLKDYSEKQLKDFNSVLDVALDIQEIGEENNREMYFVIFPNKIQVENHEVLKNTSFFNPDKPNELIRDFCTQHQLQCLDLLPITRDVYQKNKELLFFPIDRHANPKGTTLFAETIFEYINEPQ